MYAVCILFLYFMIYSVIGWACETVWCSIGQRRLANRGFLNGPLCPIYGFGALAVLYLLRPFTENLFTVFLAGIVLTSVLEYITGYLLEKLFHLKLWDYSKRFCNLNGRVCLRNSILFGVMSVALVWFIHPFLTALLESVPTGWIVGIASMVFAILIADLIVTVYSILKLNGRLAQIQQALDELHEKNETYKQQLQQEMESHMEQYRREWSGRMEEVREQSEAVRAKIQEDSERLLASAGSKITELNQRLNELRTPDKKLQNRIVKAFPDVTAPKQPESLEHFKKALEEQRKKKNSEKKHSDG